MEMQIANMISITRRRRNWLIGTTAIAGTGYALYRIYQSPSISMKKMKIIRLVNSFISITEAASASAQTVTLISNDLKAFLESDADEVPRSLKQLFKVAQCQEFQQTLAGLSGALTAGITQGFNVSTPQAAGGEIQTESASPGLPERILDKLFSAAGTGFASVVVGNFARNLVLSFLANYSNGEHNDLETQTGDGITHSNPNPRPNSNPNVSQPLGSGFVDVLCSNKCKLFMADCIRNFVGTAVAVYLDKTMDINSYDQICSGLTNPKHEAQMKGILISVFNGAVETLVRTSHDVFCSGSSSKSSTINDSRLHTDAVYLNQFEGGSEIIASSSQRALVGGNEISISDSEVIDVGTKDREQVVLGTKIGNSNESTAGNTWVDKIGNSNESTAGNTWVDKIGNSNESTARNSWVDKISHTLAVPSNRKLLVEVSGRVTFEAVRSFFEFMFWKVSEFFKTALPVVSHEALDTVLQIMRHVGARSLVVATVCLAICLHVLTGARVLQAA